MSNFAIGSMQNRRPRPEGDLDRQLERILKYIRRSSSLYDAGDEDEAIPLALELRKLLYDKGQSKSLLGQLKIKDKVWFVDTGLYPDKWREVQDSIAKERGQIVAGRAPILSLSDVKPGPDGRGRFVAPLTEPYFDPCDPFKAACPVNQKFDAWWDTPLIEGSSGKCFSRSDLIMVIADQENGAHVDPELDGDFQDLCVDTLGIGAVWSNNNHKRLEEVEVPLVLKSLPYSAVRQIAWEVMTTIDRWRASPRPGQFALAQPFERSLAPRYMQSMPFIVGEPVV